MPLQLVTILGARPQFIKAAPVCRALRENGCSEFLIHTGQHYDDNMSATFFDELGLPNPDINLRIGSGTHAQQTGSMLIGIEEALMKQKPDLVLVYGDTNSTLAGALAAVKLQIDVAHIEAGLRSFNKAMPEEHNRILTDHCATYLFCPTENAIRQLGLEGITENVHLVGDTMYDAVKQLSHYAEQHSTIMDRLGLKPKEYLLATLHRPYNTDVPSSLKAILRAFLEIDQPIVFPVHPRTRSRIAALDEEFNSPNLILIEPIGYLDMLVAERNARCVLTDSGGVQKEAFFAGTPCITLRTETEWVETTEAGWNILVGSDFQRIVQTALHWQPRLPTPPPVFGDGKAAEKIVKILSS